MNWFKIIIGMLLLLITGLDCAAQYDWFNSYKGSDNVMLGKSTFDQHDNALYTVGFFDNGMVLNSDTLTDTGSVLLKHSLEGEILWYKVFRYSTNEFYGMTHVKTDAQGNVYVSGVFQDWISFDGVTVAGISLNSIVIKFDRQGEVKWTKKFEAVQTIFQLAVNDSGDVGITGTFFTWLFIDDVVLDAQYYTSFGALIDTHGNLIWAKSFRSNSGYTNFPLSHTLDKDGNYYLCGRYTGQLQIGGTILQNQSSANYNMYFTKINRQGNYQWVVQAERKINPQFESPDPPGGMLPELGDMTTDDAGNIYVCGEFYDEIKIGSHVLTSDFPQTHVNNIYTAKFSSNGALEWIIPNLFSVRGHPITAENIVFHNGILLQSGIDEYNPYRWVLDSDGNEVSSWTTLPIYSLPGLGFTTDHLARMYFSGDYREVLWTGPFMGFLLRAGAWVGKAGEVQTGSIHCKNHDLYIATSPIAKATQYEWEVFVGDVLQVYHTDEPSLVVHFAELQSATSVTIRVRGVAPDAVGEFSNSFKVGLVAPKSPPIVTLRDCNQLTVENGQSITWYRDDQEISQGTDLITVTLAGQYHVIEEYTCGQLKSNVVDYTPLITDNMFFPNIITPNGDSVNERFILDPRLEGSTLIITNRWGETVYTTSDYRSDWTGIGNPSGVYFYVLKNNCLSRPIRGPVTIVR